MREQAECRHRKDGVCVCQSNSFAPFKCPYADPDASQREGYIPCPDWEGVTGYTVHRPKHFMVTLTWDIEADTQAEAEQKVRKVIEQVDGELEEVSMEQDGQALIVTTDEETNHCGGCPECVVLFDDDGYHGSVPDSHSSTCKGCSHRRPSE